MSRKQGEILADAQRKLKSPGRLVGALEVIPGESLMTDSNLVAINDTLVHKAWALGNNAAREGRPNAATLDDAFSELVKDIDRTPPHHLALIDAARQFNDGYRTFVAFG